MEWGHGENIDYNCIDEPIRNLILLMNQSGFETLYSCASRIYEGCHQYQGSESLYVTFKGDIERLAKLVMRKTNYSISWDIGYFPDPNTLETRWNMNFPLGHFSALEDSTLKEQADQLIKIAENFFEGLVGEKIERTN